jgi:hypothetical protein
MSDEWGSRSPLHLSSFITHHSRLAMALLAPLDVARRIAALFAFFALILLALTLFWRVYVHHNQADPYEREEAVTVRLDVRDAAHVKFASGLR